MAKEKAAKSATRRAIKPTYTAVFQKTTKWWVAFVEELPGANTQGKTKSEARRNLKGAVRVLIEANRELVEKELHGARVVRERITVTV